MRNKVFLSLFMLIFTCHAFMPACCLAQPENAESQVPVKAYDSLFKQYQSQKVVKRKAWQDANKQVQQSGAHMNHNMENSDSMSEAHGGHSSEDSGMGSNMTPGVKNHAHH